MDEESTGIDLDKYRLTRPGEPTRIYGPGDVFPLIRGDALAVMTLRSYGNNCLAVMEWKLNPITGEPLTRKQEAHLRQLYEDAVELSFVWAKDEPHLPD